MLASLIEGGPASSIVKEHLLSWPEAPSTADQQCVCQIGFSAADRAALQYGVLSVVYGGHPDAFLISYNGAIVFPEYPEHNY